MKVRTLVETTQEVEVDVSLDDVMAEIAALENPASSQEAVRILNLCISAVMKVPDSVVSSMTQAQREIVSNALRDQSDRYATT